MKSRTPAQRALPVGTRVRLSEEGQKTVTFARARAGTVTGYGRDGESVRVRWDYMSSPQPWFCYLLIADPR